MGWCCSLDHINAALGIIRVHTGYSNRLHRELTMRWLLVYWLFPLCRSLVCKLLIETDVGWAVIVNKGASVACTLFNLGDVNMMHGVCSSSEEGQSDLFLLLLYC